jgi:uncharacterized membrane protein
MANRLNNLWESLISSLWFVPSAMTFLALALAFASVELDHAFDGTNDWTYGGGPEGAREVLSAVAGSMITVAGVSFSVMIVALTLASQQFGPRLLRNFMRDTGNQVVLGAFIATFSYCLIVMRTIRGGAPEFVPHLSVTLAIVFALASLGVLIYFIHHAAVSIQAPELIAMVANDLRCSIDRLFPEKLGQAPAQDQFGLREAVTKELEEHGRAILATGCGYLQSINGAALMATAKQDDLVLFVKRRPGDFIFEREELASCRCRDQIDCRVTDCRAAEKIRAAFILGTQRTHIQDLEFTLQQLVEVAVRALSPSVNDPFTAINCIDRIAAALSALAERSFPTALRYDDETKLRVVTSPVTFAAIVSMAFDSIRHYGRSSATVTLRLLEAIQSIGARARREADRIALLEQAQLIERASRETFPEGRDRMQIDSRFKDAIKALQDRANSVNGG